MVQGSEVLVWAYLALQISSKLVTEATAATIAKDAEEIQTSSTDAPLGLEHELCEKQRERF